MPTVKLRHFSTQKLGESITSKKNSNSGSTVVDFERFAGISGMDSFDENASTPIHNTVPSYSITLKNTNKVKSVGSLNFDENKVEELTE